MNSLFVFLQEPDLNDIDFDELSQQINEYKLNLGSYLDQDEQEVRQASNNQEGIPHLQQLHSMINSLTQVSTLVLDKNREQFEGLRQMRVSVFESGQRISLLQNENEN